MTPTMRFVRTPAQKFSLVLQQRFLTLSAVSQKSFPALVQEIKANNKNIHHISPKDLHAIPSTQAPHVIDVRERHEIENSGTIPGAIVLPRGVLERDVGKFIKQDDPRDLVVYCAGGFRSILAAESLIRLGYGNPDEDQNTKCKVWSLNEGMDGWINSGFEVEKKNNQ
ncbi:hypothetical protein BGZ76_009356 [Entomortierella beljakovae]|nr:hypothetical protein BGZ76_009356 [Entomortierella beljakovae]